MTHSHSVEDRPVFPAMIRGFFCRCPNCGSGRLFSGFLRVSECCAQCNTELHHHRADDAPPYFTMLIVGHLVIGSVLWTEVALSPPMWLHLVIWLPLTLILSLALLRPIKGIIVALQWALRMHGFGGTEAEFEDKAGSHLQ